jgi:hypothetical protein
VAAAVANIGIAVFTVLGPIIAEEELGGAASWGIVLTGGAVGGLLGGAAAYRLKPSRPLVACFVAWSLGTLPSLALMPPLPALAIAVANGAFVLGIAYGNAVWETVLQREIAPERLSRVSAFDWLVSRIFMPLGQALAGPVAAGVGTEVTLAGAAVLIALSCAAGIAVPSVRGMRATGPPSMREPAPSASAGGG